MTGISVNITVGLLSGMFSPIREEARATTPRSGSADNRLLTRTSPLIQTTMIELVVMTLCIFGCLIAFQQGRWWLLMMLSNVAIGCGWVGLQSAFELLQPYFRRQSVNIE
jgi:hypothetical protein